MKKKTFCTEFAYVLGLVFIAVGVAFTERSDFGVSMVVAPAYVIYRWLSGFWSFFTFGMAEYCLQALLLAGMALILRRFRLSYLFSFVTAVIYGFILDGCMLLAVYLPAGSIGIRLAWYFIGNLCCAAGVSLMFHTYLSPEVYELFVKEVSLHFHRDIHRFKSCYDAVSCLAGLALSFGIFGLWQFVGVKWGTIVCAIMNGWTISLFSRFLEHRFAFCDALPWRPFFTGEKQVGKVNAE